MYFCYSYGSLKQKGTIKVTDEIDNELDNQIVTVKENGETVKLNIKNSKIRGSRRKKKGYLNHGIGLNSVKQIVEKFNGIVEVQDFGEMYEVSAILYGICDDKDLGKSVL